MNELRNIHFFILNLSIKTMRIFNNILETIGNTPLVKLNKIAAATEATILAKIETTNPGNSVKDRMALKMIEDAEMRGDLKPGGTIIECTSGNTGMGIAIGTSLGTVLSIPFDIMYGIIFGPAIGLIIGATIGFTLDKLFQSEHENAQ